MAETQTLPTKKRTIEVNAGDEYFGVFSEAGIFVMKTDKNDNLENLGVLEEKDFLAHFDFPKSVTTGLMSPGTIYYERLEKGGQTYYIVGAQKQPAKHTIKYNTQVSLHLPFLQMFVLMRDAGKTMTNLGAYCTCTTNGVKTLKDKLFLPPLGNIGVDASVCFGRSVPPESINSQTPTEIARTLLSHFLSSPFNYEIAPKWPTEFKDVTTWMSKYNTEESIYDLNYYPYPGGDVEALIGAIRATIPNNN